jgi:peptide/nickel transport system ATP-binding protein/oligopeptide transport system ATP-binding protein
MRVSQIVAEPLVIHRRDMEREDRARSVEKALEAVGLGGDVSDRRPGQLSGGQQQRVGIARAIVTNPDLIVLDEPTSSLDVSVEADILELLGGLQKTTGVAYLFISHDIEVVNYFSDRVAVMYRGVVVEQGSTRQIMDCPGHPYTRALLSANLSIDPDDNKHQLVLPGEIPAGSEQFQGCPLVGRCPIEQPYCGNTAVGFYDVGAGHEVACLNLEGQPSPARVSAKYDDVIGSEMEN